jgi:2-succinyl-6-hydroxy-2,4-cyclohexadiene-1-carboxylate synthase
MKVFVGNNVQLNVEIAGEGEPLLLLHGFTGSVETWKPFIPYWSNDLKLIMVDVIGHGNSDIPEDPDRYTMERAAGDLANVLDYLDIAKIHLLGYSMGGRLAISFAILFPDRVKSLALESSSPGLQTLQERQDRVKKDRALAERIEREGIKAFVDFWERIPLFASQRELPESFQDNIRKQRLQNNPIGLSNSLRGMGTGRQPSWWEQLTALTIPVLLLVGEKDIKFCSIAEQMDNLLERAKIYKVPQSGHAIHVEQPRIFGTIVSEFLQNQKG